jgi:hypothetical protein
MHYTPPRSEEDDINSLIIIHRYERMWFSHKKLPNIIRVEIEIRDVMVMVIRGYGCLLLASVLKRTPMRCDCDLRSVTCGTVKWIQPHETSKYKAWTGEEIGRNTTL